MPTNTKQTSNLTSICNSKCVLYKNEIFTMLCSDNGTSNEYERDGDLNSVVVVGIGKLLHNENLL